jgi:hypothetical protein
MMVVEIEISSRWMCFWETIRAWCSGLEDGLVGVVVEALGLEDVDDFRHRVPVDEQGAEHGLLQLRGLRRQAPVGQFPAAAGTTGVAGGAQGAFGGAGGVGKIGHGEAKDSRGPRGGRAGGGKEMPGLVHVNVHAGGRVLHVKPVVIHGMGWVIPNPVGPAGEGRGPSSPVRRTR